MIFKRGLIFFSIILILHTISCKNNKVEFNERIVYFENGKIKEKWFLGKDIFDSINVRTNNIEKHLIDSSKVHYFNDKNKHLIGAIDYYFNNKQKSVVYYSNGFVAREGFVINDSLAIGKWNYYTYKGILESVSEFKNIEGQSYLNQTWYFDERRDTIGGYFYNYIFKDSIYTSEDLKVVISLVSSYYSDKESKIMACISESDTIDFNETFSNDSIALACAFDVDTDTFNKNFVGSNHNLTAVFGKKFKTSGKKLVRGIIYEYLVKEKDSLGLDKALENAHKMYFEIPVFVKDSV